MSRNLFFFPLGILFVAILTACGKSEVPTSGLEATSEMESVTQAAEQVAATPEDAVVAAQTGKTQNKAEALYMANGLALAQKNNCLACHKIDTKLVGPAWRDVAKKYKGVPGSEHMLVIVVSTGGAGNWGNMPMPAMAPAVKEEDIRALVKFVLSLEK